MKKFIVHVGEVWVRSIEVEASDEKEARRIVGRAIFTGAECGEDGGFEFSHLVEGSKWFVEEVE